jgi:hypothetical protein
VAASLASWRRVRLVECRRVESQCGIGVATCETTYDSDSRLHVWNFTELRTSDPLAGRAHFSSQGRDDKTPVRAYRFGAPIGRSNRHTSGTIASAWNSLVLVRSAAAGFSEPVEVYEVDLRENFGNSGGPVFGHQIRKLLEWMCRPSETLRL